LPVDRSTHLYESLGPEILGRSIHHHVGPAALAAALLHGCPKSLVHAIDCPPESAICRPLACPEHRVGGMVRVNPRRLRWIRRMEHACTFELGQRCCALGLPLRLVPLRHPQPVVRRHHRVDTPQLLRRLGQPSHRRPSPRSRLSRQRPLVHQAVGTHPTVA
jgi:hypothetical protein